MAPTTIKNTAHQDNVIDIMKTGLIKGSFSDVILSVPGDKNVVRCHKTVLARCSPFLSELLGQHEDQEEPVHVTLCGVEFREVMAMLNLIYLGKVSLPDSVLSEKTRRAAQDFLGIEVEKDVDSEPDPVRISSAPAPREGKRRRQKSAMSASHRKRPLMIRGSPAAPQSPIIFFLSTPPPSSLPVTNLCKPEDQLASSEEPSQNSSTLNSYQKAKQRCADKYKCDICFKGFPLSCLLQRHKRTHADNKPFQCSYCPKSFSSKTSLNHHLFMRHSEEQAKKIENGKKLIENLKLERSNMKRDVLEKVDTISGTQDVFSLESCTSVKNVQNMEILAVEDITQQIEVQIGRKEVELEEEKTNIQERCASVIVSSSDFMLTGLDWWKK